MVPNNPTVSKVFRRGPGNSDFQAFLALGMARSGIPVFPIVPGGKAPLTTNGWHDKTTDIETVRSWWRQFPHANIGIVPADQNCVVLDEDPGADPALVQQFPPTMTVRTPRGRHHYFFSFEEYGNRKFAPGIDTRCAAGYVLAPGSLVDGNRYVVERDCEPADLPAWIREQLAAPAKPLGADNSRAPVSEAELRSTLSRIDPGCDYNEWVRILAAIASTPCDGDLAQIALDWSTGKLGAWGCPANTVGDDYDMEAKLATFGSDGVTYATLVYLAMPTGAPPQSWIEEMEKREAQANTRRIEVNMETLLDLRTALENVPAGGLDLEQLILSLGGVAPDETMITAPVELPNLKFAKGTKPTMVKWLWDGWLAQGKLHLLAGVSTAGKSTIAFDFAATLSRGGQWPGGSPAPRGRTLIWSSEDDWSDTILPRLLAAGADIDRVHFIDKIGNRSFDPAKDVPYLYEACIAYKDVSLLILDPILNVIQAEAKETAKTRRDLTPVVEFARATNTAVLGITHFTKNSEKADPLDRIIGSQATGAYARIVMAAQRLENSDTRKLVRVKSNIGRDGGGFEYRLEQRMLEEGFEAQGIAWGNRLTGSARDLLSSESKKSETAQANDFLNDQLANGPVLTSDLRASAMANCISWRTIERAKAGRKDVIVTLASKRSTWELTTDHRNDDF